MSGMATSISTLGGAIRAAREERGWARWELAQELGIDPKNIDRWEGDKNQPSHAMYARLCRLFGWPLPYAEAPTPHSPRRSAAGTRRKRVIGEYPTPRVVAHPRSNRGASPLLAVA